jgi:iron(III) transport system ATP-binding protein
MAKLNIEGLHLKLGNVHILKGVDIVFNQGDVVALLGRSGSGKTTLLRAIAGLEQPSEGRILIGDKPMFDSGRGINLPPEVRGLGLVFQSYALWPHKTVFDNVAYGVRIKTKGKEDVTRRVKEAMAGLGIDHLGERFPHQLSGGQQQRVALARALVYDPPVILLDEPLSNLDAALREEARIWIRALIKKSGLTGVFVTHDQEEALAVADKIVLLDGGTIVQSGSPQELYAKPQSFFASTFLGANNVFDAKLMEMRGQSAVLDIAGTRILGTPQTKAARSGEVSKAVIRVESVALAGPSDDNCIEAELDTSVYLGSRWEHIFRRGNLSVRVNDRSPVEPGTYRLQLPPSQLWVF